MILARINLVPQKPLAERIKQIIPAVLVVGLCLAIFAIYLENRQLNDKIKLLNADITKIEAETTLAAQLIIAKDRLAAEINLLNKNQSELKNRVTKIEKIRGRKKPFSEALISIAKSLPTSVKCNKISFQKNSGKITGTALRYDDLPIIVKRLTQDPKFKNVVLHDIDRVAQNSRQNISFSMMFELN
ncbi:MAG: PilN domain-containing protein [Proteobacteria bacterium]|nr:PilN domain-containing protein [Pseudomonadota bacterium]MBU1716264.1 PilN domain-containing protein [Pseudomonadota bacterium]